MNADQAADFFRFPHTPHIVWLGQGMPCDDKAQAPHEMMACEHPRGVRPLVGAQVRYLVASAHGWIGAPGFAASALQLPARDTWIGWDPPRRGGTGTDPPQYPGGQCRRCSGILRAERGDKGWRVNIRPLRKPALRDRQVGVATSTDQCGGVGRLALGRSTDWRGGVAVDPKKRWQSEPTGAKFWIEGRVSCRFLLDSGFFCEPPLQVVDFEVFFGSSSLKTFPDD
jgi:hypothetical protein